MHLFKSSFLWLSLLAAGSSAFGQNGEVYVWRNLAGRPGGPGNADGNGATARFNAPAGVAADGASNLYVADYNNNTIRKINSAGIVSTLAGESGQSGTNDGPGTNARFNGPTGVAADASGNIYVADFGNNTIRKVTPAGVVSTLAGRPGFSGTNNGTGTNALFNGPAAVAVDAATNIYVADFGNNTIRKVTSAGVVTTLAGNAGHPGTNNGAGTNAQFSSPSGLAVDSATNIYVADEVNYVIRRITSAGVVTTLAGSMRVAGTNNGTGTNAQFYYPSGVAVDAATNVYVSDLGNDLIRKISSTGVVTTLAGATGVAGTNDGVGTSAFFNSPISVSVDAATNVYVADYNNNSIRKVAANATVTTLAGSVAQPGSLDGTGTGAQFNRPSSVAVDAASNVYVADEHNQTIRKVTTAGVVTILAGRTGQTGSANGTGTNAFFNFPSGVAVDNATNVFVADQDNHVIRKITSLGVVTTLAGKVGQPGTNDGIGTNAQFNGPLAVAVDGATNVYVADYNNNTIRRVTSAGVVTTLAGWPGHSGANDGSGTNAQFNGPIGVTIDGTSNLFVADSGNNAVRKVTSAGLVSTFAGNSSQFGTNDGTGTNALFTVPAGVAVDSLGNLFVADEFNYTIRKVTSAGVVTTIGGTPGVIGDADGIGSAAKFGGPTGIAVDGGGRVYVADFDNNRISIGTGPPALAIRSLGANVLVSWPSPFPEFALQQNATPTSAATWQTLGYTTNDDGTNKTVIFPLPSENLIFRLIGN